MKDLLFNFSQELNQIDLAINNSEILTDESLKTCVLISIFTDARCDKSELPKEQISQKGFWGDAIFGGSTGSKLWLLNRSKLNNDTIIKAKEYAHEALRWLVIDGLAKELKTDAEIDSYGNLNLFINIIKPSGQAENISINNLWENTKL